MKEKKLNLIEKLESKIENQKMEIFNLQNCVKDLKRAYEEIKSLKQEISRLSIIKNKRIDEYYFINRKRNLSFLSIYKYDEENKPNDQKDAFEDDFAEVTKEFRAALNSPNSNSERDRLTSRIISLQTQLDSLTKQLKNCTCKYEEVEDLD